MNKLIPLLILSAGPAITGNAADWNCRFTADRSATLDASGAKKIVIGAGAGDLNVRGQDGQTSLRATGRACASSEDLLGQIQLESRREGDTVYLKTLLPQMSESSFGFNRYATLDLTVNVPTSAVIDLEDSSGDLQLNGVQSAVVADSSGDMEIGNVAGNLQVTDSSGDVEIRKVGGNLNLRDSSGDVEIEDVQGGVEIPVDSSGDIQIERVAGVHIVNDSSGEIIIDHVKRDVRIDTDSSGDISVDDVGGNFTVGADASGSIRHSKVAGTVQVPEQSLE